MLKDRHQISKRTQAPASHQSLVSVTQLITSKAQQQTSGSPAVKTQQRGITTLLPGGWSRIRIELRRANRSTLPGRGVGGGDGGLCVRHRHVWICHSPLLQEKNILFRYIL